MQKLTPEIYAERPEYAGEGTYQYDCRKYDCLYCAAMGLTPLPAQYFDEPGNNKPPQLPIKNPQITYKSWSQLEINIILKYKYETANTVHGMLKGRTKKAIQVMRSKLRAAGILVTID